MRGRCGAGEQLSIDVADLFNRIADLPQSGGDGLGCSACDLVQLIDWGCDNDVVIGVH